VKLLHLLERILIRIETGILVAALTAMIVLSFWQVVLRNVFASGILWSDPVVRHLVLWVGFIGAAIATSEERHIGIDALTKFFSNRYRTYVRILTDLFALIVCIVLADAAYKFFVSEQEAGGTLMLEIPSWVGVIVIPPGYALIAFHFAVRLTESILRAFGHPPQSA
jgi:TRAP-type C4-dicarboxylate transport system permease small subunit